MKFKPRMPRRRLTRNQRYLAERARKPRRVPVSLASHRPLGRPKRVERQIFGKGVLVHSTSVPGDTRPTAYAHTSAHRSDWATEVPQDSHYPDHKYHGKLKQYSGDNYGGHGHDDWHDQNYHHGHEYDPYHDYNEHDDPHAIDPYHYGDDYYEDDDEEETDGSEMSFLDHLEDLRWTLIKSGAVFLISCMLILGFIKYVSDAFMWPLNWALGHDVVVVEQDDLTSGPTQENIDLIGAARQAVDLDQPIEVEDLGTDIVGEGPGGHLVTLGEEGLILDEETLVAIQNQRTEAPPAAAGQQQPGSGGQMVETVVATDGGMAVAKGGLISSSPLSVLWVMVQVTLIGAFALSFPFVMYFVAEFVSPGLTKKEKRILVPTCLAAFALFLTGASFSFFALAPISLKVMVVLNDLMNLQTFWHADKYFGLLVWMVLGIGITFEFPLGLLTLVYLGVLSSEKLKKYRRHSFMLFLIVAAMVTPTDPITMFMLALPLYLLYELSIIVAVWLEKKKAVEQAEWEEKYED